MGYSPWESTWYFHSTLHEIQTFSSSELRFGLQEFLPLESPGDLLRRNPWFQRFLRYILCVFFSCKKKDFKELSCICCDISVKLLLFDSLLRRVLGSRRWWYEMTWGTKGGIFVRKSRLFQSCKALKHDNHLSGRWRFEETLIWRNNKSNEDICNQSVIWVDQGSWKYDNPDHIFPFDGLRSPTAFRRSAWLLSWRGATQHGNLFMKKKKRFLIICSSHPSWLAVSCPSTVP